MNTTTIWISYDLGIQGDYEGMYAWLDKHQAKECGDSVAVLSYQFEEPFLAALKADLKEAVDITKRTRIYVIYRDEKSGKNKGSFIYGGRRASPWLGYSGETAEMSDGEI